LKVETQIGPSLTLRLLGGMEARTADGRDVTPAGKKTRALLACLALPPGSAWSREQLTALFWGDRDEEQARGSLREALVKLRRCMGEPSPLQASRETIALDPAVIGVDAIEFARLAKAGELERASEHYRGELLEGLNLPDAGFEDWLLVERTRLHDLAVYVLSRLLASRDGEPAIRTAQRLLQVDPTREETHRTLMRLYAAAGDRSQALRQYQTCRDNLQRDLGVAPSSETEALHRQIREESGPKSPSGGALPRSSLVESGQAETTPRSKPAIAVLPFTNMSGDPDQRYFSDGITEDIITELSRNHGLFVIARNSSFQYRDVAIDVKRVARDLCVQYVVEGSVRRGGDRIRITAQLLDGTTGGHLWAHRYDRNLQDIFAIQDEVTTAIVGTVVGQVQAAAIDRVRRKRTGSLAAYDYFLRGLEHLNRSGSDDTLPARAMFERAIEIDPDFSRAHALLAWMLCEVYYAEIYTESLRDHAKSALDQALQAAQRSVALDGNDALCHCALGYVQLTRRTFDLAAHHIDIAAQLNPNDAEIIASRNMLEVCMGRPQQALHSLGIALKLNPTPPNWYREWQGLALYGLRRYDEAATALECATVKRPYIYRYLAACYAQMGRLVDAKVAVAEALRLQPHFTLRLWTTIVPLESPADRGHVLAGLRKAGLPE
jgi:TolB-like protein/Flp pilus assembly protein TadD